MDVRLRHDDIIIFYFFFYFFFCFSCKKVYLTSAAIKRVMADDSYPATFSTLKQLELYQQKSQHELLIDAHERVAAICTEKCISTELENLQSSDMDCLQLVKPTVIDCPLCVLLNLVSVWTDGQKP